LQLTPPSHEREHEFVAALKQRAEGAVRKCGIDIPGFTLC
jgi:hypothetical protein